VELIDADGLRRRLRMRAAIDALETAFAGELPPLSARTHEATPDGGLFLMPAAGPQGVGVKLITLTEANRSSGLPFIQGVYVLFRSGTQEPEAVIDGAAMTALRTGAVSGLATRLLARDDAHRLVVFGSAVQARSHVEAVRAVREVDDVVIVSPTPAHAEGLAREVGGRAGTADDVREADVICTCTPSAVPLFDGAWLPEGVHVNAIGAYTPVTRELDGVAMARGRVVVETRDVAMAEAGDLLLAIEDGAIDPGHVVADLQEVVRGKQVRRSPSDITIFKSVGMAFEDLVVARAAVGVSS
jgi:ornithine cyclodeaminase